MDIPIQYTRKQVENFNNSSIQTVQQRAEAPDPIPTAGSLHGHWEDNNTVLPTLSCPLSTSGEFLFYGSTRVLRETKTYWLVPCLPNRELVCNCTGGEKKKTRKKKKEELNTDLEEKGYINHRRSSVLTCFSPVSCLGNWDEMRF